MSGPNRDLEVEKAREKKMDFLDEIEPEVLRSLPKSFQIVAEIMMKVKTERDLRRAEP